jgi:anti-sigma factor RsiW
VKKLTEDRIDCSTALELLDAHGENAFHETGGALAGHIAGCRDCAGAWTTARQIRRSVRRTGPDTAPPELRARIVASLRQEPSRRASRAPAWLAAAAALVVLAGVSSALLGTLGRGEAPGPGAAIARAGLDHHRHCMHAIPPPEVPRSEGDLASRIGPEYETLLSAIRVSIPGELTVVDAHGCSSNGVRYSHVVAKVADGFASVLVSRVGEAGPSTDGVRDGAASARSWSAGGHAVWVVSEDGSLTADRIAGAIEPAVRVALDQRV